ncbi:MAG: hypothetical protein JSV09_04535, partial [Thermoplasmata archaeon]
MKDKSISISIVCLVVTAGFFGFIIIEPDTVRAANTHYVGGGGGGNYSTIQEAIDAALPGDTVFVYDDSSPYNENVIVNKSINLIGEDRNTTVIYGGANGARVRIESNWVNISGFTVTGMGPFGGDNSGIYLDYSSHVSIDNVNVSGNYVGIYVRSSNPTD